MDNRSSSLSKSASERPGGDGGSGIDQSPDLDRNIAVSVSSNNKNTNHNHIHVSSSSGSTNDDDRESTGPLQTGASSTGIGSVSSTSTPLKLGGSLDGPNSVSSSSNTTTFMKASTPNNSNGASSSVAYPNDTGNPSSSKKSKKEKKPRKKRKSRNEDMNDIGAHDSTQSLLAGSRNNSDTMMHNNTFLSSKGSGASSSNENVSSKSGTYKNNPKNHENAQSPIKKNNSSSGFKHYELSKRDSTASNTNASSSNSRPGPKTGKSRRKERFGSNSKSSSKDGHYRRGGSSSAGNHHGPNSASSSPNNNNQRDNASTSSSKSKLHSSSQNPNNSSSNNSSTNASHRKHKKQKSSNGGNNNSSNSSSSNTFRKHKKQKTSNSGSNNSYLDPMASVSSSASVYSPEQATVNDMMRRALEEDRYSGQGSIVDTDSSEDENENSGANGPHLYSSVRIGGLNSGNGGNHLSQSGSSGANANTHSSNASNIQNHHFSRNEHLDRTTIMNAMKKRLRVIRTGGSNKLKSSRDFLDSSYSTSKGDNHHSQCRFVSSNNNSEYNIKGDLDDGGVNGTNSNSGGRKKKKKKGKRGGVSSKQTMNADNRSLDKNYNSDNDEYMINQSVDAGTNDRSSSNGNRDRNVEDHINEEEEFEEEGSIFGQTAGSTNATWVECDKCGKWRRLRGVVDAKKLPLKWYCSMNKNDPERARCSAPEEAYDTPESATDHRARKHLRLWVRRLQSNEAYEARLPTMTRGKKRSNASSAKEPYEWVRCCSPSCGKWRAILKFMDANSVIERAKNGEWYCVLNTWDEKFASCAAPQENLPAIGCPPWVIQDEES